MKGLRYDPDDAHRRKHGWEQPRAAVVAEGDGYVGKCPSTMDRERAQELLEGGFAWWGRNRRKTRPERVYNVYEGVPYRASLMGGAYHGFPEVPSRIPPEIRDRLRDRAAKQGYLQEFDAWTRTHEEI